MIELLGVTKKYGDFTAVRDVSLKVNSGEIFGFLGPNGAGKTTTIKIMVGLLKATSGRVIIDGKDIERDHVEAKRVVGFIPDQPFLYEKLTGAEFLQFISDLYGLDRVAAKVKIEELFQIFDLVDWQDELVENYSHGMKQRLVMSAALIHKPKAIIVDEPMVGLDPRGAMLVKEIFREEVRSKGTSIFMSTHTLEIAEQMCDRIAIIQEGVVIAHGTPAELRELSGKLEGRLESVFLSLTGGEDSKVILEVLKQ